jgi:hypothetical protein
MRGAVGAVTGIWGTGPSNAPFLDREVRALTSVLIAAEDELLCAAGEQRAVRNGAYAAVELAGLGPLNCGGAVVSGNLRYCHDCVQGDPAITGELEGETVLELTGSHARSGDTLFLQMGWAVLIAHFDSVAGGEKLRDGAYLSFSNQVYCFDSASGNARDIASADITFTGFRRAGMCQADGAQRVAQACVKQFAPDREW